VSPQDFFDPAERSESTAADVERAIELMTE
jgi:hypothetical protein